MRTFKIVAVALIVMYVGIEAIGNIEEDFTYHNQSDIRVRMAADQDAYNEKYN